MVHCPSSIVLLLWILRLEVDQLAVGAIRHPQAAGAIRDNAGWQLEGYARGASVPDLACFPVRGERDHTAQLRVRDRDSAASIHGYERFVLRPASIPALHRLFLGSR